MSHQPDVPPLPLSPAELDALEPGIRTLLLTLWRENLALKERVRDLEARLNQNSSNSSRPPSSDPPWAKPVRRKKPKSGRRRGGQPGHPPHLRELFPPDKIDETREHQPAACAHCGNGFVHGIDEELEPHRHQVIELPEVKPFVTEHRLHVRRCSRCQGETTAAVPAGVPLSSFGPRLQSWVATLTARFRLSKREAQELLREIASVAISLGSISDIEQYVSESLEAPVAELREALKSADVVGHDETGWREANQKAWLWTTVDSNYAVYKIDLKRSGEVARSLLGGVDFQGYVQSDRYKAYNCYPMEKRAICHAHLARDYKKIADRPGPGQPIGIALCEQEAKVFHIWHQFKAGTISRPTLKKRMNPVKDLIESLLQQGKTCGDTKVQGMCADILGHAPAMWTFLTVEGVEPTNNHSEQALRPYVLWRKGSFGTQSERGSRFMERMMSVIQTCRRQGRHLLSFITHSIEYTIGGRASPPSLLIP
jgi:transposase